MGIEVCKLYEESMSGKMLTPAYRYALSYPSVPLTLRFDFSDTLDIDYLDQFLINMLDIAPDEIVKLNTRDTSQTEQRAYAYLQRILLCNKALLQIGKVPIYDDSNIMQVKPLDQSKNIYQANLAIAFLDNIPLAFLKQTINLAIKILTDVIKLAPQAMAREELDNLVNQYVMRYVPSLQMGGVSTMPILNTAHQLGVPVRYLGSGVYQLGWGAHSRIISRSALDSDSCIGAEICNRKDQSRLLLMQAGLPVSTQQMVRNVAQAVKAAQQIEYPVVIKPANRERSEGVTTMIENEQQLSQAFEYAASFSKLIVIEKQIPGKCYRLLIAAGKFLYCVERGPRAVVGDGKNTIAILIEQDTQAQQLAPLWRRKKIVQADEATIAALTMRGYQLSSIPAQGEVVPLRIIESTEWSETTLDVTDKVHPENILLAERAANSLCLSNAGVDLITTDISRPWWEVNGIVTEVNFRPHFGASDAAKQRMKDFFARIIQDNGIIPIAVFVGDESAWQQALQQFQQGNAEQTGHYLCSAKKVMSASGDYFIQAAEPGLFGICRVMLQNKQVKQLFVVIQDTEFNQSGLPFNAISSLDICSKTPLSDEMQQLINTLQQYIRK